MDPFLAALAEFWWIGPTVIGAGAVGWFGMRQQRASRARRIALDAARADLHASRSRVSAARIDTRVARAEVARMQAERSAGRASSAEVASARRALDRAQRELKAATADVRVRRAHVTAARAALPAGARDPAAQPLPQLMAAHDAVVARWMAYETDPARLIAFPTMSDGRQPLTAAYLEKQHRAQWLRPASATARMRPAEFTAYRDAVAELSRAFEVAEADAWTRARAAGTAPAGGPAAPEEPTDWKTTAQQAAQNVVARASEAINRALAATRDENGKSARTWERTRPTPSPAPQPPADAPRPPAEPPRPPDASGQASADSTRPVWPVPSRTDRPRD